MFDLTTRVFVISAALLVAAAATAQTPSAQPAEAIPLAAALSESQLIDLTHPFDETTIYWPTEDGFQLSVEKYGMTDRGYFYAANRFAAAEHGGTHLDAPIHFAKGGQSVDQIPLERLVGEAAVIDVREACRDDRDYLVGVEDLRQWEVRHGRQLIDVIVLIRTGYGQHWSDRARYLGTDQTGPDAVADLHFPGLAEEAARWLCEHRSIKAIGIDTASIDRGQSRLFAAHVTLFRHEIPAFENVAQLERLPSEGATVIALPMNIGGGTGGPLRIIAAVPNK